MSAEIAFAASCAALNEWVYTRVLRTYQAAVIRQQTMAVVSPVSGEPLWLGRCLVARSGLAVGYVFQGAGQDDIVVLTGEIGRGYELKFACCPRVGRAWVLGTLASEPQVREIALDELPEPMRQIAACVGSGEAVRVLTSEQPLLLGGHPNFAHLAWNNLPALKAAASIRSDCPVILTSSPLGRLTELLDGWSEDQLWRVGRIFKPGESVIAVPWVSPVGSSQMSLDFLAELKAHLSGKMSPAGVALMAKLRRVDGPVFWFSLRKRQRNCQNSLEFLGQLCRQVLLAYPRSCVIFDGFALPVPSERRDADALEFDIHVDEVQQQYEALVGGDDRIAAAVSTGRVMLLNGGPLVDALCLAQMASFYVCHGGTQQHKLAWFHAVPGMIHVPDPSRALERWYADQSAISLEPVCLPMPFIEVLGAGPEVKARNRDYRIRDVRGAVTWTMDQIRYALRTKDPVI